MNRTLLKKCVKDVRLLLFGACFLLFTFCWIRVWVVSQIEMPRFTAVMELIWDKFGDFSTVTLEQLASYPGRVALTYVEPLVVFMVVIWGIARGSDVVSGELSRGTMEVLLSQPLSRMQVMWHQSVVTIAGVALLALAAWAGTWAGLATNTVIEYIPPPSITLPIVGDVSWPFAQAKTQQVVMTEVCDPVIFFYPALNLFAMGICISGIAAVCSAADRYRFRTIGIVAAIFILQFVIKGLAMASPDLRWMLYGTFMTAFDPQAVIAVAMEQPEYLWSLWMPSILDKGETTVIGPLGHNAILLGIGVSCYVAASIIFQRRDLPAPV